MKIYEVLGIEAVRRQLISEFRSVHANSGSEIDYGHFSLLADTLTFNGRPTSIHQSKVRFLDPSPLSLISYERHASHIYTSSIFAQSDNMINPTSSVMFGEVIHGGTGYCDIIFDESQIGIKDDDINKLFN
jgi:DNA-directed RNA polymerase beta' subunit